MLLVVAFLPGYCGYRVRCGYSLQFRMWYDASKKGFATGVFGAGMVGTRNFCIRFTPAWCRVVYFQTHVLIAVICAVTAAISFFFLK